MRHLKAHRKLGRTSEHRHSMLRNLATSLINSREERIVTTLPKAKELRPSSSALSPCRVEHAHWPTTALTPVRCICAGRPQVTFTPATLPSKKRLVNAVSCGLSALPESRHCAVCLANSESVTRIVPVVTHAF